MGRSLIELLDLLLRAMKGASDNVFEVLPRFGSALARVFRAAALPEVLGSLFLSLAIAAVGVALVFGAQMLLGTLRQRGSVFISFHHSREPSATAMGESLLGRGLSPTRLPFEEGVDHDVLLDRVRDGICKCDVLVCLPGTGPSFVESEVSMAFGLAKPMLFVVSDEEYAGIPDTAKKGYPIFSRTRLESEGYDTLSKFCSYLAADWRSTVRLYTAAFAHLKACSLFVASTYLVSVSFLTGLTSRRSGRALLEDPFSPDTHSLAWFVFLNLALFAIPYAAFTIFRWNLRKRVRRVVSGREFSTTYLAETLDFELTRTRLLSVLHLDKVAAHHESAGSKSPKLADGDSRSVSLPDVAGVNSRTTPVLVSEDLSSSDKAWLAMACACYMLSRGGDPHIPCPKDLLPASSQGTASQVIYLTSIEGGYIVNGELLSSTARNELQRDTTILCWVLWFAGVFILFGSGGLRLPTWGFFTVFGLLLTIVFVGIPILVESRRRSDLRSGTYVKLPPHVREALMKC